eukprot:6788636-Alexandrium_andersonii.AAC.1
MLQRRNTRTTATPYLASGLARPRATASQAVRSPISTTRQRDRRCTGWYAHHSSRAAFGAWVF